MLYFLSFKKDKKVIRQRECGIWYGPNCRHKFVVHSVIYHPLTHFILTEYWRTVIEHVTASRRELQIHQYIMRPLQEIENWHYVEQSREFWVATTFDSKSKEKRKKNLENVLPVAFRYWLFNFLRASDTNEQDITSVFSWKIITNDT